MLVCVFWEKIIRFILKILRFRSLMSWITAVSYTHLIRVSDDGMGFDTAAFFPDERQHVGIENVRFRLAAQCAGTLKIESHPGGGTKAVVTIPKNK